MAAISNLYIDQGSDYSISVSMTGADGSALNLTGATFLGQVRKTHASSSIAGTFTTSHDATGGNLTLSLTDTITAGITAGRYVYDVLMTDSGGDKTRVLEGQAIVTPSVSRS